MAKYISRISGTGVQLETASWSALRQNSFATVRPSPGNLNGWVHFPIPTPFIIEGDRMKSLLTQVRFENGSGARVRQYRVSDGGSVRLDATGLDLNHEDMRIDGRDIEGDPLVNNSIVVSLRVQFSGTGPNDWIRVMWAAVAFHNA